MNSYHSYSNSMYESPSSPECFQIILSACFNNILKMVYKCSVIGCFTNYAGYERGTLFLLPQEDLEQRMKWLKFLHRKDSAELKNIWVCYKHFADDVLVKTPTRVKLEKNIKAVPTICPDSQKNINLPPVAVLETIKSSRKLPKERIFQPDQFEEFKKQDSIMNIDDLLTKGPKNFGKEFIFDRKDDCTIMYKLESNAEQVPRVTFCIRVDNSLRVKLYYMNSPISLPAWFRQSRNTVLTSCSMLQNFINHMKQVADDRESILSDLEHVKFQQNPSYPARVLRFAIELRHTSLQAYNLLLKELPLPSVSLLRQITKGK